MALLTFYMQYGKAVVDVTKVITKHKQIEHATPSRMKMDVMDSLYREARQEIPNAVFLKFEAWNDKERNCKSFRLWYAKPEDVEKFYTSSRVYAKEEIRRYLRYHEERSQGAPKLTEEEIRLL